MIAHEARSKLPVKRAYGGTVMESRDDVSLLKAIANQRDHQAFTELFERHRKQAFSLSFRVVQNSALAEEAVQEAMLSIWLAPKLVYPKEDAREWIMGLVVGKSLNIKRSQRQRAKREECTVMEPGSPDSSAAQRVEETEQIAVLRSHIDQLPERERELLACCFGANMSHHKIGELLRIPRQTVTDKIQQICGRLRASLANAGVAAVVPLVSAGNLFQAMTTGAECPPTLTAAKALSRIAMDGARAARSASRRFSRGRMAAASKSGGLALFIVAAFIGVAAMVVGWIATRPKPVAYVQPATQTTAVIAPVNSGPKELPLKILRRFELPAGVPDATALHSGAGELWAMHANGNLSQLDPETGAIRASLVVRPPAGLASIAGNVLMLPNGDLTFNSGADRWLVDKATGSLQRIPSVHADSAAHEDSVEVAVLPEGIARNCVVWSGHGAWWAAKHHALFHFDSHTGQVLESIHLPVDCRIDSVSLLLGAGNQVVRQWLLVNGRTIMLIDVGTP